MIALWNNLPIEVAGAILVAVVYLIDVAVTKTKNPLDNMIWRWLKSKK